MRGQSRGQVVDEGLRDGTANDELVEGDAEATVDQQRGRDAAGQRAQLVEGLACLLQRRLDRGGGLLGVARDLTARATEVHRQADEALLRPVVDVALEAAECHGLGLLRGIARALGTLDPGRHRAAAVENDVGERRVQPGDSADDPRQRHERDQADREIEQAVRQPAVAEADEGRQGLVALALRQPQLPDPVGQPGHHDRPPHHRHDERGETGDERERSPQGVEPHLRVAQRRDQPRDGPLATGGDTVGRRTRLASLHRDEPDALEARQPRRGDQRGREDEDADPDDQRRDTRGDAHDGEDEADESEREGGEGVQGVPPDARGQR